VRNGSGNPAIRLDGASGDITANDVYVTSDARLKTDIRPLQNALRTLLGLRGVEFAWRRQRTERARSRRRRHVGVVAQEVESIAPELVGTAARDGYKSVDLRGLVALLIEGYKELVAENRALNGRVATLEKADTGR
jgi:Chaperone of endosialidase